MGERSSRSFDRRAWSRRGVIRAGLGGAAGVLSPPRLSSAAIRQEGNPTGGKLVFLSTQLTPAPESTAMRERILAGFEGEVEFINTDDAGFIDRIRTEANAPQGTVALLGGQHGHFAPLHNDGLLADLSDLAAELADRRFVPDYLALGHYNSDRLTYIPWMQATYIMAARREALEFLPDGLDEAALRTALTYDDLAAWAAAVNEAHGPKFGLPLHPDGLLHRFLQGYAYPSYTGGVNTTFASDDAVAMWQWLTAIWQSTHPAAADYAFMQEPLATGDVWIAWDHTARLIEALRLDPAGIIAFPAPRGPVALGYMPAIAGLAIPKNAPDPAASRALIEYLTRPAVQAMTAREVSFFPTIEAELPEELPPGAKQEADAINATLASERAIPSLLPVGLGARNVEYNDIFRRAFARIITGQEAIEPVLAEEAVAIQAVLDAAGVPCWAPDPKGDGVCRVG